MGRSPVVAHRLIAAAAGAAITLSLTGCQLVPGKGGTGGEGAAAAPLTASQILQKVSQRADNTDSYKARIAMKGTIGTSGAIRMRGTMYARVRPTPAWRMRLTQAAVNGRATPGGMDALQIGDTIYLKSPTPAGGKPWLKLSVSKTARQSGLDGGMLKQNQQMDLVMLMKLLTSSKDARKVGAETVGGVATTHFTGTYAVTDALGKLDARTRQQAQSLYRGLGMDKLGFDLWVDGQQVPRKLVTKTLPGSKTRLTTSLVFYDIGKPVSISPPPASAVSDINRGPGLPAPPTN